MTSKGTRVLLTAQTVAGVVVRAATGSDAETWYDPGMSRTFSTAAPYAPTGALGFIVREALDDAGLDCAGNRAVIRALEGPFGAWHLEPGWRLLLPGAVLWEAGDQVVLDALEAACLAPDGAEAVDEALRAVAAATGGDASLPLSDAERELARALREMAPARRDRVYRESCG